MNHQEQLLRLDAMNLAGAICELRRAQDDAAGLETSTAEAMQHRIQIARIIIRLALSLAPIADNPRELSRIEYTP